MFYVEQKEKKEKKEEIFFSGLLKSTWWTCSYDT